MLTLIIYEVKVAILLAIFYLCYKLLLSHETLHKFNRIVLICTTILSFILPLCVITIHKTVEIDPLENFMPTLNNIQYVESVGNESIQAAREPSMPWWQITLIATYIIGAAAIIVKIIIELIKVRLMIKRGERHFDLDGTEIIVIDADIAPFSWMHWIVMSRTDYDSGNRHIINHEKAHIAFRHSNNVLIIDILSSMQWFNPTMWLLRADLRAIYEYEADDAVLRQGANIKEYQYSLIKKAVSASGYSITNSLNHSILKNRITMMSKSKTSMFRGLRALYIVPLVAAALATNAQTVVDYKSSENEQGNKANEVKVINYGKMDKDSPVIITKEDPTNIAYIVDGKNIPYEDFKKIKTDDITLIEIVNDKESEAYDKYGVEKGKPLMVVTLKRSSDEVKVINYGKMDKDSPVIITKEDPTNIAYVVDGKNIPYEDFKKIKTDDITSIEIVNDKESEAYDKYGVEKGKPLMVVTLKKSSDEVKVIGYGKEGEDSPVIITNITKEDPTNMTYAVDGKIISYEDFQKIKSSEIASIEVIKDNESAFYDKYGVEKGKPLMVVTLKKSSDEVKVIGYGKEGEDSPVIITNITKEDPTNMTYAVDGKIISYEDFQKIKSSEIASIEVIKDNESAFYDKYGVEKGKPLMVVTLKNLRKKEIFLN